MPARPDKLPAMLVSDPHTHYARDAELFDYFAEPSGPDLDSAGRIRDAVLSCIQLASPGLVLDLGSGNGWLNGSLARNGHRVVSVDLGIANLRAIRGRYPGAMAVVADSRRLPFRNDSFDCAVCSEVLEHVNDPAEAVSQIAGALRSGGTAVITTPYREKIKTYLCIHCNRPTPANAHIHSFDETRHRAALERAGLRAALLRPMQNPVFITSRLSHLLRLLPYRMWRMVDGLLIFTFRRANTILVRATKP